ncbi:MAG: HPr family phosphocarrier protein [Lentisphaeria bacterium]|nr:HPr family phosphocarrier protein [Lentisphaeria bacterium]
MAAIAESNRNGEDLCFGRIVLGPGLASGLGGIHARPASKIAQLAASFRSTILLARSDAIRVGQERIESGTVGVCDSKSVIGAMMLAAGPGETLYLMASGDDARTALDAMAAAIRGGLTSDTEGSTCDILEREEVPPHVISALEGQRERFSAQWPPAPKLARIRIVPESNLRT